MVQELWEIIHFSLDSSHIVITLRDTYVKFACIYMWIFIYELCLIQVKYTYWSCWRLLKHFWKYKLFPPKFWQMINTCFFKVHSPKLCSLHWLSIFQCQSPVIIGFYKAFFNENRIYICTEFMDGKSFCPNREIKQFCLSIFCVKAVGLIPRPYLKVCIFSLLRWFSR